jgi:hypothetical protein
MLVTADALMCMHTSIWPLLCLYNLAAIHMIIVTTPLFFSLADHGHPHLDLHAHHDNSHEFANVLEVLA